MSPITPRRRFLQVCVSVLAAASIVACTMTSTNNPSGVLAPRSTPSGGYTNFEVEPVRPLALSADGRFLYALNTADDRLEIFSTEGDGLRSVGETLVGLRPVALALRGHQAWVVNHLSDSVSVVDVSDPARPRVTHTMQVGDEPRGIVVAGAKSERVFVAAAYRGETLTPGVGRGELWIFDAERPESAPTRSRLFGGKLRGLTASADGRQVFAAVFLSGNGTASVAGDDAARLGRIPQLYLNQIPYDAVPKQGPIVRRVDGVWRDAQRRDWNGAIPFELPDYDVFAIDAAAPEPRLTHSLSGVGTVLFNLAVQPGSGELWVSNTEALNHIPHEPRLNGRFAENRITRLVADGRGSYRVQPMNLNAHVDLRAARPELGLAQPLEIVFQPDGREAYVAAFGSRKIAVLDRAGRVTERIAVGFGPGGLALDAKRQRLYALNHLDVTISIVDVAKRQAIGRTRLRHDPTPALIKAGRPFFYDAALTSRHGDLSCATCHVFGDADGLAWDLGDPDGASMDIPAKLRNVGLLEPRQLLHPLKGPMVTQSLRGLADSAPFHWRGDRFGAAIAPGDAIASFKDFNDAFVDLLGRAEQIPDKAMEAFARFVMTIRYPPNPFQSLDRSMRPEEKAGFDFFTGPFLSASGVENCVGCHSLPLGTNRLINFEHTHVGRDMKAAQLRNVYDKVGRFNTTGAQVSGFGLIHDGTFDTVANFLRMEGFIFPGKNEAEKDVIRRQLHEYVIAFDTGMAPAVGRQITVQRELNDEQQRLLDLLTTRASAGDCDLVVHGWEGQAQRGWLLRGAEYLSDRGGEPSLTMAELLARYRRIAEPLTFTCVPPGDGRRSALDRDLDGALDGDARH